MNLYLQCVPETQQSALYVELLIKAVQPDVVVVEVPFQEEKIPIPTSYFGVLKKCFVNKTTIQQYENIAAGQFLEEIFGIGVSGNVLSAKRAASEVNSTFLNNRMTNPNMSLSSNFVQWLEPELRSNYKVPSLAQSVYHLLTHLHDLVMNHLPAIGNSLADAQKMLTDVNEGLPVDIKLLYELYLFEIALELPRIALNNEARSHAYKMTLNKDTRFPVKKMNKVQSPNVRFSKEEMENIIIANALKSQGKKFKTIVAVVDASNLAGIRKNWNTPVSQRILQLVDSHFIEIKDTKVPWWIYLFPYGAGATLVAASTLKLLRRSNKLMPHNTNGSVWTAAPDHIINAARANSLVLIKSSLMKISKRHKTRPIEFRLWAILGCSVITYTGLELCRDRFKCVLESTLEAPRIAHLGRGLRSLHNASQEV